MEPPITVECLRGSEALSREVGDEVTALPRAAALYAACASSDLPGQGAQSVEQMHPSG